MMKHKLNTLQKNIQNSFVFSKVNLTQNSTQLETPVVITILYTDFYHMQHLDCSVFTAKTRKEAYRNKTMMKKSRNKLK